MLLSDRIALFALVLSGGSLMWQVTDALNGPDLSMLSMEGRVVEFRCLGSQKQCWAKPAEDGTAGRTLSVIAPVFAANRGANGQHEVLERVTLSWGRNDTQKVVHLDAKAFWGGSAGTKQQDVGPYQPILVEGGGVFGEEVRFVGFHAAQNTTWRTFADDIIDGRLTDVTVEVQVSPLIETRQRTSRCSLKMTDRARAALRRRKAAQKYAYLSLLCEVTSQRSMGTQAGRRNYRTG